MQLPDDIYESLGIERPETTVQVDYDFVYSNNVALPIFFDLQTDQTTEAALQGLATELARRLPFRDDVKIAGRSHATVLYIGSPTSLHLAVERQLGAPIPEPDFLAAFEELFTYCFNKAAASMRVNTKGLMPLAGGNQLGIELECSGSLLSFLAKCRKLFEASLGSLGVDDVAKLAREYRPLQHLYDDVPHVTLLRARERIAKFKRFSGIEIPKQVNFTHTHLHAVRRHYRTVAVDD